MARRNGRTEADYRKEKYRRGSDYRYEYIRAHPGFRGWYMCPYCGMPVHKDKMQVDHIIPIHKVRTNGLYWGMVAFRKRGVNDLSNLTHSCPCCNKRKGRKAGFWVVLGHFGWFLQPIFWVVKIALLVFIIYMISTYVGQV